MLSHAPPCGDELNIVVKSNVALSDPTGSSHSSNFVATLVITGVIDTLKENVASAVHKVCVFVATNLTVSRVVSVAVNVGETVVAEAIVPVPSVSTVHAYV